jgi:hypothetical protein
MKILKAILIPLATCLVLPAQVEKTNKVGLPKVVQGKDEKKVVADKGAKQGKQGKEKVVADKGAKQGKEGKDEAGKVKVPGKVKPETKPVPEPELPIPAGADPADIAAMKSARSMIEAEKRLAALLKAGKLKGIDKILPFEEIASWPYEDGLKGMPKPIAKLDGKTVMMTGFMLPIDEVENIKEFLLVQSLWSCCYGQPPDINGTVRVVMKGKKRIDYKFDPIKIIGTFKIKATVEDGFCVDIYQLDTDNVEVIK